MSDRLIILGAIAVVVLACGTVGRVWAKWRRDRLIGSSQSGAVGSGTARILSFYGPSCAACDRQKAVLAQLAADRSDEVVIELRDATTSYDTARQFGLVIVPTTVVFRRDGVIAAINSGFTARPVIEAQLAA